jgi:glycosyltransferase involved in cell wall biosynthesis
MAGDGERGMNRVEGRVTVGIPTRNRSGYLMRAIESVLAQTYPEIEIVVSDNASDDDTWERLQEISDTRVRAIRQANNIGMVGNFNACLEAATGELFLMLSDDDLLEPTAIEKLSAPLREGIDGIEAKAIGMTWCQTIILDADGQDLWQTEGGPRIESPTAMLCGLFTGKRGPRFSSVMLRTDDVIRVGGYDEDRYGAVCDTANWGVAALHYEQAVCIQQPLVKYTVHAKSETMRSACVDWQNWGRNMHDDMVAVLQHRGGVSEVKRLKAVRNNLLANLTVTVLLPSIGQPGWIQRLGKEGWSSRKYLLTPYVFVRLLREGWKMLRLKKKRSIPGRVQPLESMPSSEEEQLTNSTRSSLRNIPWVARLTSHIPPGQFARYLVVGAWNTLFGYSTYALFTALLTPRLRFAYIYASVFSSLLNITVAYFGYKFFVFKTKGNYLVEWFRCILVYGSGMLPGLVLLPLLVEGLHYGFHLDRSAPYIAGALLLGVGTIYSFFGHKHFSFRVPDDAAHDAATTEVEPPIEDIVEGVMPEPATNAANRV